MMIGNQGRMRKTSMMATIGAMFALMSVSATSIAGDTVSVKTPLGKTISAEKVKNPAKGTIEHQIIQSLQQIKDGKFDDWRKTNCFPARCDTDIAWEQMKNYNLEQSKKGAPGCLQGDGDEIWVTSRKGDPSSDKQVKVFIYCGQTRMPAPSTHEKHNDKWYVHTFSW